MNERAFLKECLSQPAAPSNLEARIMAHIERSLIRRIWLEISLALSATFAVSVYLLFSWSNVWLEIQESSFLQMTRLAVSDPDILFSHVQEAAWSLAESIPFESVLLGLFLVLCVTCSIGLSLRLRQVRQQPSFRLT
jgi:hypothetical protein